MEAIHAVLRLTQAQTIQEMDDAMIGAHEVINKLHLQKLQELEQEVGHRLGIRSAAANVGLTKSPDAGMEIPREKRPIRDNPQA